MMVCNWAIKGEALGLGGEVEILPDFLLGRLGTKNPTVRA